MQSERMADIIKEMRMARTEFPFAYEIGRKDAPAEFDADGLMVKPRSIVIEKVTIETLADRIEKAWEREKPQPDPDWKAICEKCKEGEIEPDCEYNGEPNGCNSPIYGEHPKANPGNAAAMREALEVCFDFIMRLDRAFNPFMQILFENAIAKAKAALAAPPRNCEVGTAEEQSKRFHSYCLEHNSACDVDMECCRCPLEKVKARCELAWAQMPYANGQEDANGND